jgi:hypothetical protein
MAFQYGQDVLAVAGEVRVRPGTGSGQQRGQPVKAGRDLLLDLGLDAGAPAQQRGHADAAFEQLGLLAREGPGLEKRSPPLSLVKMTMVLSAWPLSSSACSTWPTALSRASTISPYFFRLPPS